MSEDRNDQAIAEQVLRYARAKGVKIATAESCTGGMVSAALTDIAGSSEVFERGFVTYSNAAKIDLLGVQEKTLRDYGAVSEQVAQEMATGALAHSQANLAIAITGIAGPGGTAFKPEGRVCFALAFDTTLNVQTIEFGSLGRDEVRKASKRHALNLLVNAVKEQRALFK